MQQVDNAPKLRGYVLTFGKCQSEAWSDAARKYFMKMPVVMSKSIARFGGKIVAGGMLADLKFPAMAENNQFQNFNTADKYDRCYLMEFEDFKTAMAWYNDPESMKEHMARREPLCHHGRHWPSRA